ncbi:MAG: ATP-binding protein [Xanthobacteraceae bacterium]|nr:ATP-binding protein [Xanthobacteraceae bacterium]
MARFTADITPHPEAIGRLADDVSDFLRGAGVDARAVHHVALVIEEILTNVATHGGCPDLPATIALEVRQDRVSGEIGDQGRSFDPRTAPTPDIDAPIDERQIGGLGLHLVKHLTSALEYRSDGTQNWTTFCIPRT